MKQSTHQRHGGPRNGNTTISSAPGAPSRSGHKPLSPHPSPHSPDSQQHRPVLLVSLPAQEVRQDRVRLYVRLCWACPRAPRYNPRCNPRCGRPHFLSPPPGDGRSGHRQLGAPRNSAAMRATAGAFGDHACLMFLLGVGASSEHWLLQMLLSIPPKCWYQATRSLAVAFQELRTLVTLLVLSAWGWRRGLRGTPWYQWHLVLLS